MPSDLRFKCIPKLRMKDRQSQMVYKWNKFSDIQILANQNHHRGSLQMRAIAMGRIRQTQVCIFSSSLNLLDLGFLNHRVYFYF